MTLIEVDPAINGLEKFQAVVHDVIVKLAMITRDDRYCTLHDGSIRRNPIKKPLLHNGGKPRV